MRFGEVIKDARSRQGWDQARFAELLGGVGQQTVSRWERGLSRPRRAVVIRLAELLELNARDLLTAAGYTETTDNVGDVAPPVQPRSTTLPLDKLAPEVFEQFSADLAQALHPDATVHRYGSQGHTQGGIDIEVRRPTGKPIGIQCKRETRFGPAKVAKAVAAVTVDVDDCYIYLTRVASPQARREMDKHVSWTLWDIEDLSRAVRSLPNRDAALRIVDTYFPGWREPFLGVRAPGPWLTSEEFFRPVSGDRIYTHDWQLVGRASVLSELRVFASASGGAIAMIVGRGGIGKTRLLRALAAEVEPEKLTLRFLAIGAAVEPAQFDLLPPDDRLVVVVDDAHEHDHAALIGGIQRVRPNAKILLSLRPQGLGQLTADLRQVGVHPSEIPSWTLNDLKHSEAERLAGEILGPDVNRAVIQRLGAVAPDCPLLVVVGATLIKRKQLDPRLLESSDSIRMEILTRFRDVVVTDRAAGGGADLRREALKAVAAMQPFRIDKPEFQEAISSLTGRAFDQVMPHLRGLEGSGVLLRRGTSFRVVPDLLGDVILADAAIDALSGTSVGYLERVFRAGDGEVLQHALVNASRVDWQVRQDGSDGALIEPLWAQLAAEFRAAGIYGRLSLLKLLERVAFFQPDRTLALVRWAIANPTETIEEIDHPLSPLLRPGYTVVLEELPTVLRNVGYDLDHLPATVDLLWELARHDRRPTNQHPYHPIRVLSELAAYGVAKPPVFQEIVTDAVQRWLEREDITDWPYSPFEVLEPLLATEVESRRSDGLSITLSGHAVRIEAVEGFRSRVLDLAFTEARSADLRRAVHAVQALGTSITYPHGMFGRHVSTEERDRWTPQFVKTVDRLGQLAANEKLDPVVSVAVTQALRWHAQYSATATGPAARAALARIANAVDRSLAQVLHDGWSHAVEYSDDVDDFERRRLARLDEVAAAVTSHWSDEKIVDHVAERLTANRAAYGQNSGESGPFVWTLVQKNPTIGEIICRRVINDPTSILQELIHVVLGGLTAARPSIAIARAHDLLATQNITVQRSVAQAFGWGRGNREGLLEGEAELLRSLIRYDDPVVRRLAVAAARSLGHSQNAQGLELVTAVRFADAPDIAEEIASVFAAGRLSWSDLTPQQADDFFRQLRACPRIDSYSVITLLGGISQTQPHTVLDLLQGRVETYEQDRQPHDYEPLPHIWHKRLQFRDSEHFIESLRSVIGWVAEGVGSWHRRHEGAEIFAVVAERFDEQVLTILTEAIESGDRQQIQAVGAILRTAPRTLVWDEVSFVTGALRTAEKHGQDSIQAIGDGLHAAVTTGGRMGTPGQPFPEDIEQRDKSIDVAAKLPRGSIEQRFYQSLAASAESRIRWEEEHDRVFTDRRDW